MGAPLFLPRKPLTSQPQGSVQIDWANPITRGLALAWTASAPDIDLVTSKATSWEGTTAAEQPFVNRLGRKFVGAGNLSFGNRPDLNFSGLSQQTIFTEVFIDSPATVTGYVCGRIQSDWDYGIFIDGPSQQFDLGTGGKVGANSVVFPSISVAGGLNPYAGRPVPLCLTYDGTTARAYVDGGLGGSAAQANSFPNTTDQFAIGARGAGNQTGTQLNGASVSIVLIYKRTLSASEAASLSANPWQIFKSQQREMWLSGAGGPNFYNVSCSDTLSFSEGYTTLGQFSVTGSDALALAESLTTLASFTATRADTLSLVDSSVSTNGSVLTSSDTLTLTDSITTSAAFNALSADVLTMVDLSSSINASTVSQSDTLALTELYASILSSACSIAETLTLSDVASTSLSATVVNGDTLVLTTSTNWSGSIIYVSPQRTVIFDGGKNKVIFDGGPNKVTFGGGISKVIITGIDAHTVVFGGGINKVVF